MLGDAVAIAAERLGEDAACVLARLAGPLGHEAREAAARLGRLSEGARLRRQRDVATTVRAPVPTGLRDVHPSWTEQALEPLPVQTRAVLAIGATGPVEVWLARWATAEAPPVPHGDGRDPVRWLSNIGADQFAHALGEAARGAAGLVEACERITQPPRAGELGPKRAALARCRGVSLDDELAFVRVGTRALAPHLATDQLACLQLLRKLPQAIAIVVERELRVHATTSVELCPSRIAIDAP